MRTIGLLLLASLCIGCVGPQGAQQSAPLPAPAAHPLADKVFGRVVLGDGKTVTGRVTWNAAAREYMVVESARSQPKIPADRVSRIVVLPSAIEILAPTG